MADEAENPLNDAEIVGMQQRVTTRLSGLASRVRVLIAFDASARSLAPAVSARAGGLSVRARGRTVPVHTVNQQQQLLHLR